MINTSDKQIKKRDMGNGYYLEYEMVSNNVGGYHPVNIVLKNSRNIFCRRVITDAYGNFVNFPGVTAGKWEEKLDGPLYKTVKFNLDVSRFSDGVCTVLWQLQPDGRYFADEGGFGGEDCEEIILYSKMNTKGEFICPFKYEHNSLKNNCMSLF